MAEAFGRGSTSTGARSVTRRASAFALLTAVAFTTACTASPSAPSAPPAAYPRHPTAAPGIVRYRLLISNNPVDPGQAFRCYGGCRESATESTYLECLSQCPGFEVAADVTCEPDDGIPRSVCIVQRPYQPNNEPSAGAVVAFVALGFVLMFALPSLCAASGSQCYNGYYRY